MKIFRVTMTPDRGSNLLYSNNGDGTFTDITQQAGVEVQDSHGFGQGICTADVNNDGWLDVFVANFGQSNTLYLNKGGFNFEMQLKSLDLQILVSIALAALLEMLTKMAILT